MPTALKLNNAIIFQKQNRINAHYIKYYNNLNGQNMACIAL